MEYGRLAGWGICNNLMGDVMDWVQLGFTIVVLGVILVFECKVAFGKFIEKKDLQKIVDEYMGKTYICENEELAELTTRIDAFENEVDVLAMGLGELIRKKHVPPIKPESPTLQAVESGARIASEAFTIGSKAVLDALTRDGRIAGENQESLQVCEPTNLGEEDYDRRFDNPVLADIIMARNQQAAKQMGETINDDLMKFMDGMGK